MRCGALRCPAVPCNSAQQSAAPCGAALCRASPCCVLCGTFTSSYMAVTFAVSYHVPVLLIRLYILRCWITNKAPPAQVSPALYNSTMQRSIVRCRALPFVLRCCVVRRCAFFRTYSSSTRYDTGTRYHYVRVVFSSFCFLQLIALSRSPCPPPPPPANITRTAVQNVTSTSTQHRAGQLALHKHLLALSLRCLHLIITSLFFLPPSHVSVAFFLARA